MQESTHAAPRGAWFVRLGPLGFLVNQRGAIAAVTLFVATVLAAMLSLSSGEPSLTFAQTWDALLSRGDMISQFLVQELRVPRTAAGLLSGAAMGVGGCLLQTLARNRLATPGIIGIDDGATAFAVASIVAVPTTLAPSSLALVGAATAAALAFGLSGQAGSRGYRFIVVGIAIGALFGALTNLMLARTDIDAANLAYPWTVGSLNARPAAAVWMLGIALLVCLPLAKMLGRTLATMRFSDSIAVGLGTSLQAGRILTLAITVVLTAAAVAVVGPVGLIALAAPEVARHLAGHRGVPIIGSALSGALIMVLSDLAGRRLFAPIEVPVGVITAVIGGPYLLWILLRDPSRRTA